MNNAKDKICKHDIKKIKGNKFVIGFNINLAILKC